MVEITNTFKIIFDFAYQFMNVSIPIYGIEFSLWQVFIFVLLGSVLWWAIVSFFDN